MVLKDLSHLDRSKLDFYLSAAPYPILGYKFDMLVLAAITVSARELRGGAI
jgi:hypothetical protein